MTRKERLAKRKSLFSLGTYLQKKALKRAEKLTYRAAKRQGTLPETVVPAEQIMHEHGPDCDHDHEHVHIEEEQV